MKKIILLLFAIAIFSNAFSQKLTTKYLDNEWNPCPKEKAKYYRKVSYDSNGNPVGIIRDYYMSGQIQWEGRMLKEGRNDSESILDGKCIWYTYHGNVERIETYSNGMLNGKFLDFYFKGSNPYLHIECYFKNGKKDGVFKKFNGDGNIILETTYKEDSIHGKYTEYKDNGEIEIQGTYINGLQEGEFYYCYYDDSYHTEYYVHGIRQGESKYYTNNVLESISNFKNGELDGIQLNNFYNNVWDTTIFKNGIRQDIDTILNFKKTIEQDSIKRVIKVENADTISDISYLNNIYQQYHGHSIEYAVNDSRNYEYQKHESNYSYGKRNGEQKIFYSNGVLSSLEVYKQGEIIESRKYNEIGNETANWIYDNNSNRTDGYGISYSSYGIPNFKDEYFRRKNISEINYYPNGNVFIERLHSNEDSEFSKYYDINGNLAYTKQKIDCKPNHDCKYKITFYDKSNKVLVTVINSPDFRDSRYLPDSVIPFKFRKAEQMIGNYYDFNEDKYYNHLYLLPNNVFKITKDSLMGVYSKDGKEILPCNNSFISDIQNGCIIYKTQNYYSVVDIFGKQSPFKAAYIQSYLPEGFILYCNSGKSKTVNQKFGLVDFSGKTIIPCIYDWISEDIQMGVIWVRNNGKLGAYSTRGKLLFSPVFIYQPSAIEINNCTGIFADFNGDTPIYNRKEVESNFSQPQFTKVGVAIVMQNGKYGLISKEGRLLLNCMYDSIVTCNYVWANFKSSPIIALVCLNSKWGAVDIQGKYVIPLTYSNAMPIIFYKGKDAKNSLYTVSLLVQSDKYWGVVSDKNETLIPFSYDYGFVDSKTNENPRIFLIKDSIPYCIDAYTLFANFSNSVVFKHRIKRDISLYAEYIKRNFQETGNYFWYNKYNQTKFSIQLNSKGKIIVPPMYNYQGAIASCITKYRTNNGKSLYVTHKGKVLYDLQSGFEINSIHGTIASVFNKNNKWGIYDVNQKRLLVDTLYDAIYKFDETDSVFWVRKFSGEFNTDTIKENPYVGGWGLVTIANKIVLDCKYDLPFTFSGNNAKILLHDTYGVVNKYGKIILPIAYKNVEILSNGFILFGNETWGLADNNGKILYKPQWTNVTPYVKENLLFWSNTGIGVIDKSGNIVKTIANSDIQNSTISLLQYFDVDVFDFKTYPNMKYIPTSLLNTYIISTLKNESYEQNNKSFVPIDLNEDNFEIQSCYSHFYKKYKDFKNEYCFKFSSKVEIINNNANYISFLYTQLYNRHDIDWSHYIYSKVAKQEFYNYVYANKQVRKITLQDIFKTNSKYMDTLNLYLKEYVKEYNLQENFERNSGYNQEEVQDYISFVKDSYIIDKDKIIFYLSAQNISDIYVRNSKKYITLEVTFKELKNVLNFDGVLKYIVNY